MALVDYDEQSNVYDRGRGLSDETAQLWMMHAQRHAPEAARILDLGSGTGRFSAVLADAYDAVVVGVEPSEGMRGRASTKLHARVRWVGGAAENIPLTDACCDLAWLSNVIHHFVDLDEAARELRRVVASSGQVLIRSTFSGRVHPSLVRFFPGTQRIIDRMPSIPETIAAFQAAGFDRFYNESIEYKVGESLAEMVPKIQLRADSTLELISDEEFEQGLELLARTARVEHGPVLDSLDLLVLT
jgi:ubiquinone/menaquinone biosynthesis C-methylase UbiE